MWKLDLLYICYLFFSHPLYTCISVFIFLLYLGISKRNQEKSYDLWSDWWARVRLLHCDLGVSGLKHRNSLCACGGKAVYMWPSPDLAVVGVMIWFTIWSDLVPSGLGLDPNIHNIVQYFLTLETHKDYFLGRNIYNFILNAVNSIIR